MREQAINDTKPFDYAALVERIRIGDRAGEDELYRIFVRGFRCLLARSVPGQDIEDQLHDTFIALVRAIRQGAPKRPEALPAFAHTILRRQIANTYRGREVCVGSGPTIFEVADGSLNGLDQILRREQRRDLKRALTTLAPAERKVIMRFYIADQSPKQIQADMQLTEARFYRLKARGRQKLLATLRKPVQRVSQSRKREKVAV